MTRIAGLVDALLAARDRESGEGVREGALSVDRGDPARRFIVAIAGPPGVGKSTLTEALLAELRARLGPAGAALVPMDGYHVDNGILDARGDRARKGAPWTFDVGGLSRDLARVRADDGPVLVPVFDRELDLARAAAA